ncbi:MAG: hypothetical protein RL240_1552 [Planctomycetota bacterium]|jgi:hypothetical protein
MRPIFLFGLAVFSLFATSNASHAGVISGGGYTASNEIPYAYEDISNSGTTLFGEDVDDDFWNFDLGFDFKFFGTNYNTVLVSTNGLFTFVKGTNEWNNYDFDRAPPFADRPFVDLPSIAAYWDDIVTATGRLVGEIRGMPGARRAIFQWTNVQGYTSSPSVGEFQAIFYERNGRIRFNYSDVDFGDGRSFGGQATIGIRDTAGHISGRRLQWSFDQAIIPNGSSLQFTETVPEPSSMAIFGLASAAFGLRRSSRNVLVRCLKRNS